MSTASTITDLLKRPGLAVEYRILRKVVNWPTQESPYTSTFPTVASTEDITDRLETWTHDKAIDKLISDVDMTFRGSDNISMARRIPFNDLVVLQERWVDDMNHDSGWMTRFTGLIDGEQPVMTEESADTVTIMARDPLKMMDRKPYRGIFTPSKILIPTGGGPTVRQQLTKIEPIGQNFYEFVDGTDRFNHTVNWCKNPRPRIYRRADNSNGSPHPIQVDGQQVLIKFGEGRVLINKDWFKDKVGHEGTKAQLDIVYSRYARWEDALSDATLELNRPEDALRTLALEAGFQETDPSGLFYIQTIEPVTLPTAAYAVWTYESATYTNRTAEANSEVSGDVPFGTTVGDILYVGMWEERFPAVHFYFSTLGAGWAGIWEYWNGSAWTAIPTIDLDTTNSANTNGFVCWESSAISAWTRNQPSATMPNAFYVRLRCTNAGTRSPVASSCLPGLMIQLVGDPEKRYTYTDNQSPLKLMQDLVLKSSPPNYLVYCDSAGNLNAKHIEQQTASEYTLGGDSIDQIEKMGDDSEIYVRVVLKGKTRDRFNAALASNGAKITALTTTGMNYGAIGDLIDGKKDDFVQWLDDSQPPVQLFTIELAGQVDDTVYEINSYGVDSFADSTADYPATEYWNANYNDGDANTYGSFGYRWHKITAASVQNLEQLRFKFKVPAWGGHYPQEFKIRVVAWDNQGHLRNLATFSTDGGYGFDTVYDQTITDLGLTNILSVGFAVFWPPITEDRASNYQSPLCYDFRPYKQGASAMADVTITSNLSGVANVSDADESTGLSFVQRGDWINLSFPTPRTVGQISILCALQGVTAMQYKRSGETNYTTFDYLYLGNKSWRQIRSLSAYNDVTDVRLWVVQHGTTGELSEVEVFGGEGEYAGYWTVEYTIDGTTWIELPGAQNVPLTNHVSITKNDFGDELYPTQMRFTLESCNPTDKSSGPKSRLYEVRVWTGDTVYGIATLGQTLPLNSTDDLALAGRLGYRSYIGPEVDPNAPTQQTIDDRAIAELRNRVQILSPLELEGVRPDADIGDTVKIDSYIKDFYGLSTDTFLIEGVNASAGESALANHRIRLVQVR